MHSPVSLFVVRVCFSHTSRCSNSLHTDQGKHYETCIRGAVSILKTSKLGVQPSAPQTLCPGRALALTHAPPPSPPQAVTFAAAIPNGIDCST